MASWPLQSCRQHTNFCGKATQTISVAAQPGWLLELIDESGVFSSALQLGLSHEAHGFRLLRLSIRVRWGRQMGSGYLSRISQPPCFPFCQLMKGFGELQFALGPLSFPPLFNPLQSWVHPPLQPSLFWGCCGAVQSWTDTQPVAGWHQLTPGPDVMPLSVTGPLRNDIQVQWTSFKQISRCGESQGSGARPFQACFIFCFLS